MAETMFIPCHRCGVRSEVIYVDGPDEWDFCGHHGREHDTKLRSLGYTRVMLSDDCDSEVVKS